jgi:hypothetical protein
MFFPVEKILGINAYRQLVVREADAEIDDSASRLKRVGQAEETGKI